MATENKGIYFTELTLKNVRCFGDEAVLKLSNDKGEWTKWNVILGDNGTGKTTLLQCLAGLEQVNYNDDDELEENKKQWQSILFSYFTNKEIRYSFKRITNLNIPKSESIITGQIINASDSSTSSLRFFEGAHSDRVNGTSLLKEEEYSNIFIIGYGANRRISFQILSEKEIEPNSSATLFNDDAKLINAEEWLLQMEFAASRDSAIRDQARKRSDLIKDTLKRILHDVDDVKFSNSTDIEKPVPRLEFKTPYGWVGIKELSYGYKTMVAWIVDVAARMFKRYPNSQNPLEEPVVILVDEIDLHLHPKWQRQIFEFLETRFPRAQFIVTAHSPLIVQSAPKDANIIVLKKEKVGAEYVVKIDNDKNYVRNWRVDQILASDLFDEVGVRNSDIEKQMDERRTLLKKERLTDTEKVRLDELNKIAYNLPSAESIQDIKAMDIIREAAEYLKNNKKSA